MNGVEPRYWYLQPLPLLGEKAPLLPPNHRFIRFSGVIRLRVETYFQRNFSDKEENKGLRKEKDI